jgi:hypothetical protein
MDEQPTLEEMYRRLIHGLQSATATADWTFDSRSSDLKRSLSKAILRLQKWSKAIEIENGTLKTAEKNQNLYNVLCYQMAEINRSWKKVLKAILTESLENEYNGPW